MAGKEFGAGFIGEPEERIVTKTRLRGESMPEPGIGSI